MNRASHDGAVVSQAWKNAAVSCLIQQACADGYEVHQGNAGDGTLCGRWFWTWSADGRGIETSEGDWATEEEAWGDAIVAHASDLMEP